MSARLCLVSSTKGLCHTEKGGESSPFANSQVMGKAGHYALKHVSSHVHAWPFVAKLSGHTTEALRFLLSRILEGRPRRITKSLGHPWLLFTDALTSQVV